MKTRAKKGKFESFMSKIFQMRDQVGFQDVLTRLQSCFGGAPSVDAHSEQISISFIIESSLCYFSSFEIHMLSLTASRMKFVILFIRLVRSSILLKEF